MKFGKSLNQVIELSDPEWSPFWINYKYLKRKIRDIIEYNEQLQTSRGTRSAEQQRIQLCETPVEVEFFRCLKKELKKVSTFFANCEIICSIRRDRLWDGLSMLKKQGQCEDDEAWTRMLASCVKFYKDVLLLENYAIMNYCGFSKILKKHDKRTGFSTRDAYLTNVISQEKFTKYPFIKRQLREVESIFEEIQSLTKFGRTMPLSDEEKLFIEAIRDLNYQATQVKTEEKVPSPFSQGSSSGTDKEPQERLPVSVFAEEDCGKTTTVHSSLTDTIIFGENGQPASSDALLQASIRANVLDPLPNMPAILSWMQSISHSGSFAPLSGSSAFIPRGLDTANCRGSPVCLNGIRYDPIHKEELAQEIHAPIPREVGIRDDGENTADYDEEGGNTSEPDSSISLCGSGSGSSSISIRPSYESDFLRQSGRSKRKGASGDDNADGGTPAKLKRVSSTKTSRSTQARGGR